ncbi:type II toxin-antitoxin system VapC family toxin [Jiella avicenniae]|uniref:Ribonuclease VapC n=1 Tax=Jiella avicenniae TaxID=2907202 RepID=A0A9X1T7C7_9HYPH|nr:type II toxin-antitoxin system VapC family toxin [Jiella avicenniae]MCE7030265.1 type II toxin-antitoxin system VapC family toxin [Jiella avicenniae]
MIVLDTSALMGILLAEPEAEACTVALERADRVLISAGTLAEALIVAARRGFGPQMENLILDIGPEVAAVDRAAAEGAAKAYARWGKGFHHARLNYGDCFAYELADRHSCALLYIGSDFAQTDIPAVR